MPATALIGLLALAALGAAAVLARLVPAARPWLGGLLLLGGSALAAYGITARPSLGMAIGIGVGVGFAGLAMVFWPLLAVDRPGSVERPPRPPGSARP